jgi:hypothetical protein
VAGQRQKLLRMTGAVAWPTSTRRGGTVGTSLVGFKARKRADGVRRAAPVRGLGKGSTQLINRWGAQLHGSQANGKCGSDFGPGPLRRIGFLKFDYHF